MKFHNLDEIYTEGLQITPKGFECPVCGKVYKREKAANIHYDARSCWDMVHLFRDTPTEVTIRSLANVLLGSLRDVRAYSSMKRFRKSSIYQLTAKLIMYNITNDINDIENYVMWGMHKVKANNPAMTLNFLLKDRLDFSDFYDFRRSILTDPEQSRFYDQNIDRMTENPNFMIRQVEKGWLTFEFISTKISMSEWMMKLNDIQAHKVRELLKR